MSFQTFELAGIEVPVFSVINFNQTYSQIGGETVLRMQSGTAIKQVHWSKIATTITGSGTIPPGLLGLDYSVSMVLKCAAKRAYTSVSNVITLPAARRTDPEHAPRGFGMVDRELVATTISIVGDDATMGGVAGAQYYVVHYWPQLTVFASPPEEAMDINGAANNWSLEAEEV